MNTLRIKNKKQGAAVFLLVMIPFSLFLMEIVFPLCTTVYISLTKWRGVGTPEWTGLTNYMVLLKSSDFRTVIRNTLILSLFCTVGQVGIALLLTLLMTTKRLLFRGFHQAVIFFPVLMSPLVVGYIWRFIYNNQYGLLNTMLRAIHAEGLIRLWLDDTRIVLMSVSIPVIWQYIGLYLIIMLGAAFAVPKEIYESTQLDGANGFQQALHITLPLIKDSIFLCVILCAGSTMKIYDHLVALTNGGPGRASESLAMYAYDYTFKFGNFGIGSAIAVTIPILAMLIIGLIYGAGKLAEKLRRSPK